MTDPLRVTVQMLDIAQNFDSAPLPSILAPIFSFPHAVARVNDSCWGSPGPNQIGSGTIVRIDKWGVEETIATGLSFPCNDLRARWQSLRL